MHQLAEQKQKQTNKQKKKTTTNQQNPELPLPLTQLKGSWNSSAVKKAQEKG